MILQLPADRVRFFENEFDETNIEAWTAARLYIFSLWVESLDTLSLEQRLRYHGALLLAASYHKALDTIGKQLNTDTSSLPEIFQYAIQSFGADYKAEAAYYLLAAMRSQDRVQAILTAALKEGVDLSRVKEYARQQATDTAIEVIQLLPAIPSTSPSSITIESPQAASPERVIESREW